MKTSNGNEIMGVVFPLPEYLIERFLNGTKDVFIKYLAHPRGTRLSLGHKLFFYASGGERHLLGEAVIAAVKVLKPDQILEVYGERLFLSKEEFEKYSSSQPRKDYKKDLLVLEIKLAKRYNYPIKFPKLLTMAGRYISREMYNSLKRGCSNDQKLRGSVV